MPSNDILKVVPNRERKVKAMEHMIPKGIFQEKAQAIDAYKNLRQSIRQFLETTDLPLEKIAFRHRIFGLINAYGWFAFMAAHCQRHTEQIEEVKAHFRKNK